MFQDTRDIIGYLFPMGLSQVQANVALGSLDLGPIWSYIYVACGISQDRLLPSDMVYPLDQVLYTDTIYIPRSGDLSQHDRVIRSSMRDLSYCYICMYLDQVSWTSTIPKIECHISLWDQEVSCHEPAQYTEFLPNFVDTLIYTQVMHGCTDVLIGAQLVYMHRYQAFTPTYNIIPQSCDSVLCLCMGFVSQFQHTLLGPSQLVPPCSTLLVLIVLVN